MEIKHFDELTETQKKIVLAAEEAREGAYNPYSQFYVGAAVMTTDDLIVTGSNVEESGFETVHAETAAFVRANAMGHRRFKSIAIITRGKDFDTEEVFGPCGTCRQRIFEFADLSGINMEVLVANTKKSKVLVSTIEELLPLAFGPSAVGAKVENY